MVTSRHVVVLGGGVAGIAVAVRLATTPDAPRVTLLEMRPRLGGRAGSAPAGRGRPLLDNCQHVVMGCCTAILHLYKSLGVDDRIAWHDRYTFVHGDGTVDRLAVGRLPAPLHLLGSMLRFKGLTWRDKLAIARAVAPVRRMTDPQLRAANAESFATWLHRHRQSDGAIERFWQPAIVSACNESLERVAAGYGLKVLRDGFLADKAASRMGLPTVPLGELYARTTQLLAESGGALRLGTTVKQIGYDAASQRVTGVTLNTGERLDADAVVSALPPEALRRVLHPAMVNADPRLARLGDFEVSPILGLHLWVRLPTPPAEADPLPPHVVLTGSPVHWFFDRGPDPSRGDRARHLHGVASAAAELLHRPNRELIHLAMNELRRFVPGYAGAELLDGRVIKERRATFAALPGVDALRPATGGAIGNLMLAGDWCDTGWPATMEGAARSGFAAAAALRPLMRHTSPRSGRHEVPRVA